eukprot:2286629-Pyramimonas_sp.AAC.1
MMAPLSLRISTAINAPPTNHLFNCPLGRYPAESDGRWIPGRPFDVPWGAQGSGGALGCARRLKTPPKSAKRAPRAFQDTSRTSQERLKTSKMVSILRSLGRPRRSELFRFLLVFYLRTTAWR